MTFVRNVVDNNKYKGGIYMVFEYMDHDLTGLADRPGLRFTIPQIKVSPPTARQLAFFFLNSTLFLTFNPLYKKCYMRQLLTGLHYCHAHQILHRDIKGEQSHNYYTVDVRFYSFV